MENNGQIRPFRYWVQSVLPSVYDDSLSYQELLYKVVAKLNEVIESQNNLSQSTDAFETEMKSAFEQLKNYVNEYFNNLDVQEEINTKLDEMAADGTLNTIFSPVIAEKVNAWLQENITPTSPPLDATLSLANAAAQAKAVGDKAFLYRGEVGYSEFGPSTTLQTGLYLMNVPSSLSTTNSYLPSLKQGNAYILICYQQGLYTNINLLALDGANGFFTSMKQGVSPYWIKNLNYNSTLCVKSFSDISDIKPVNLATTYLYPGLYLFNPSAEIQNLPPLVTTSDCLLIVEYSGNYPLLTIKSINSNEIWFGYKTNSSSATILWAKDVAYDTTLTRKNWRDIVNQFPSKTVTLATNILNTGMYYLSKSSLSAQGITLTGLPDGLEDWAEFWLFVLKSGSYGSYLLRRIDKNITWVGYAGSGTLKWQIVSADNNLANKKITLLGDSITEKNFRANVNWPSFLSLNGATVQNLAVSGTGFYAGANSTPPKNYKAKITSISQTTNLIGVSLSFNDLSIPVGTITDTETDNTLCGYINGFFDALLSAFPTTPVACYALSPWATWHKGVTASDNYVNALQQICQLKSIPFYNNYDSSNLRPWIAENNNYYFNSDTETTGDGTHPNSLGQALIASKLLPFLNSCLGM